LQQDDDLQLACRRGLRLSSLTLASPQTVCPQISQGVFDDLQPVFDQD
jgi:pseudouridine kinase